MSLKHHFDNTQQGGYFVPSLHVRSWCPERRLLDKRISPDFRFDHTPRVSGTRSNVFIEAGLLAMMTGRRQIPNG